MYDLTRDGVSRGRPAVESAARGSAGGCAVLGYRAPSYSITPRSLWALDILIEEGFRYDASIFPIHHDRYGIPLSPRHPYVIEREAGTLHRSAGVDHSRSVRSICRWRAAGTSACCRTAGPAGASRRINEREQRPAIFYLHPWEIDPDQPRLPAGVLGRIPALPQPRSMTKSGCGGCSTTFALRPSRPCCGTNRSVRRIVPSSTRCPYPLVTRPMGAMSIVTELPTAAPSAPATVAIVDRPDEARWNAYVDAHAEGTAYHRAPWLGVIGRAFRHDVRMLAAESAGRVVGVLPLVVFRNPVFGRVVVSVPFVNYGGVLADGPAAERALLEAAIAEARGARASHLELRHTRQVFDDLRPHRHKVAMTLSLAASPEEQWKTVDRKVRNQVRKAEKSGLRVQEGGLEALPSFYAVFARNMRDLGTPVYGKRFFREVLATFPGNTRVFTVHHGDQPVAASIVHWYTDAIEVPWASSVRDFNSLCPNVLLYWAHAAVCRRARLRAIRFRPVHAGRRHVPFQEAVGRGASRPSLGILGRTGQTPGRSAADQPTVRSGNCRVAAPARLACIGTRAARRPEHPLASCS